MLENVNLDKIQSLATEEAEDAKKSLALVEKFDLETNADLKFAVSCIAEIKEQAEALDSKKKEALVPLKGVIKTIEGWFKPALDDLKQSEAIVKEAIANLIAYRSSQRDEKLQLAGKAGTDGYADTAQEYMQEAGELEVPKVKGLRVTSSWTGDLRDAEVLIAWAIREGRTDVLQVNEKALKALTKSMGRDPKIPGWDAKESHSIAVEKAKVER